MPRNHFQPSVNLQAHYDEYYDESLLPWRQLGAKYKARNIHAMCQAVPHITVLDIGAGEGSVSAELANLAFSSQIHCLEISESALPFIRSRENPGIVNVQQYDGLNIPYDDKQFDIAFASHVLEHVEHERAFLYEASRVSKYLFIEVPLEDTLRAPSGFTADEVGHINFYNFRTIRKLLESSGLEVMDQRLFDTPFDVCTFNGNLKGAVKFGIRRSVAMLGRGLAARVFTYHCGLLCRT